MESNIYPLNTSQPWPRNQWWVAANANEVTREPMERTILGEPIVLYRTEAGEPAAMHGMCPHRGYPMVKGRVVGDAIECGYHGFTFNCDGRCIRVPSQDTVPPRWSIQTYPVVQKWEWIWVWTGDPELANPADIPDPWCCAKPGWKTQCSKRETLGGRYTLLIDNLFDLSHLHFIHGSLVGDVTDIVRTPVEVGEQPDGAYRLTRKVEKMPWIDYFSFLFPFQTDNQQQVYSEVFSDYYGPGLTVTGGPFHLASTMKKLGEMNFFHAMTPETEHTTHYFGGVSRDFRVDDEAFDAVNLDMYLNVRAQDLEAIALVEPLIDKFMTPRKELSAFQDQGGIRVRRLLASQIEQENGES